MTLLPAQFLHRVNRFQTICLLKGQEVWAHLANPGRLIELLHPQRPVLLRPSQDANRKMPYSLEGVAGPRGWVNLNTHRANDLVQRLLEQSLVPGLEKFALKKREATLGQSRFDFLLEDDQGPLWLEVKSSTYATSQFALFPDAPTQRGVKHLQELTHLAQTGIRTAVIFLAQDPGVQAFLPDHHTDLPFAQALLRAEAWVQILPLVLPWTSNFEPDWGQVRLLPLPWPLLREQTTEGGAYVVVLGLQEPMELNVGALGKRQFPAGYYVYVGSAKKGLDARLARHRRSKKKLHWHLDYLRPHCDWLQALPLRSPQDLEKDLARSLAKLADWSIPGFGASDSNLDSHLFGFAQNPLHSAAFYAWLGHWRSDRLWTANHLYSGPSPG